MNQLFIFAINLNNAIKNAIINIYCRLLKMHLSLLETRKMKGRHCLEKLMTAALSVSRFFQWSYGKTHPLRCIRFISLIFSMKQRVRLT